VVAVALLMGALTIATSPKMYFLTAGALLIMLLLPYLLGRAYLLLLIFIGLIPIGTMGQLAGAELTVLPLLGLVVFGLWFAEVTISKAGLVIVPQYGYLIALTALVSLSCIASRDPGAALWAARTYFQLFIFFFLVVNLVRKPQQLFQIGWVLIFSLATVALLVFVDVFLLGGRGLTGVRRYVGFEKGPLQRVTGTLVDPNMFALFLSMALPFALSYLSFARGGQRRLLVICVFAISLAVISTQSFGGLIGVLVSFAGIWLLGTGRRSGTWVLIGFLGLVFLYLTFASPFSHYVDRLRTQIDLFSRGFEYAGTARGAAWLAAVGLIKEYPLLGVGVGNVPTTILPYWRLPYSTGMVIVAHNTFLGIAAEVGAIAAFIFAGLCLDILRSLNATLAKYAANMERPLLAIGQATLVALGSYLIQGLLLDGQREKYIYLLLAMAACFIRMVDATHINNQQRAQ